MSVCGGSYAGFLVLPRALHHIGLLVDSDFHRGDFVILETSVESGQEGRQHIGIAAVRHQHHKAIALESRTVILESVPDALGLARLLRFDPQFASHIPIFAGFTGASILGCRREAKGQAGGGS